MLRDEISALNLVAWNVPILPNQIHKKIWHDIKLNVCTYAINNIKLKFLHNVQPSELYDILFDHRHVLEAKSSTSRYNKKRDVK